MHTRHLARYVVLLFVVAVSTVLLCEFVVRTFVFNAHQYYVWPPHQSEDFAPAPGVLPGVEHTARFRTNAEGIRAREWAADRGTEYRILAIGGSTTECLYLDQDATWEALLESTLGQTVDGRQVWIGNTGRSALNTRDHMAFMKLALDQYDVDAIIMLIGANDLLLRLGEGDAYDPEIWQNGKLDWDRIIDRSFVLVPVDAQIPDIPWYKKTATWQVFRGVLRAIRVRRAPNTVQNRAGSQLIELRAQRAAAAKLHELPALQTGLDEYERNIEIIAQEARARDIKLLLVNQPVLWKTDMSDEEASLLWMGVGPNGNFYTYEALAQGMDKYNRRLLATCEKLNLQCVDLASSTSKTTDMFYDDMHFNENGARVVASELADFLRRAAPFASAGAR